MSTQHLSIELTIPNVIHRDLNISKNTQATLGKSEKCYLGQWEYKNHKISLYTKYNKLLAIIQDLSGKTIMLSTDNIKGGVNGKIPQNVLFKMVKYESRQNSINSS